MTGASVSSHASTKESWQLLLRGYFALARLDDVHMSIFCGLYNSFRRLMDERLRSCHLGCVVSLLHRSILRDENTPGPPTLADISFSADLSCKNDLVKDPAALTG